MGIKISWVFIFFVFFSALNNLSEIKVAKGISAVGTAVQKVLAAINITKISDLDFGTAIQGDAAKTIPPGTAEDASNASFTVTGEPNKAYTILLPTNGSVSMSTAGGGTASKLINVNQFKSFPLGTGLLDSQGKQSLYVGATRDPLLQNQVPGNYSGTFLITVVY